MRDSLEASLRPFKAPESGSDAGSSTPQGRKVSPVRLRRLVEGLPATIEEFERAVHGVLDRIDPDSGQMTQELLEYASDMTCDEQSVFLEHAARLALRRLRPTR